MPADDRKRSSLHVQVLDLVLRHHDAFLLEMFGKDGAGLDDERAQWLIDNGYADEDAIANAGYVSPPPPKGQKRLDPYAFLQMMAKYLTQSPEEQHAMRDAPLDQWAKIAYDLAKDLLKPPGPHLDHIEGVQYLDEAKQVLQQEMRAQPEEPEQPAYYEHVRKRFPGLPQVHQEAYMQSLERAGSYCRGLGNVWSQAFDKVLAEKWSGETPGDVPLPGVRQQTIDTIRKFVSEATATHRNPYKLASDLASATGDYGRNWMRIAVTEMQGSFNDAQALEAVRVYGKEAKIARVPETSACDDCNRLFLDKDKRPIIWDVRELVKNGTNVGLPRAAWKATLWPLHPLCKCSSQVIPPRFKIRASGVIYLPGIEPD